MDCRVVVGASKRWDESREAGLDRTWLLGFGRRDRAHRHPAPYSRSLLGRDRPHPHHNGTGSTWFKNRRCICVWGFRYFRQSFINILGGKNKYINQSMRILIAWFCWSSNYHVSDVRGSGVVCCILKFRSTKDLIVSSTCHVRLARIARLTLPLNFFDAGRLQLRERRSFVFLCH